MICNTGTAGNSTHLTTQETTYYVVASLSALLALVPAENNMRNSSMPLVMVLSLAVHPVQQAAGAATCTM